MVWCTLAWFATFRYGVVCHGVVLYGMPGNRLFATKHTISISITTPQPPQKQVLRSILENSKVQRPPGWAGGRWWGMGGKLWRECVDTNFQHKLKGHARCSLSIILSYIIVTINWQWYIVTIYCDNISLSVFIIALMFPQQNISPWLESFLIKVFVNDKFLAAHFYRFWGFS